MSCIDLLLADIAILIQLSSYYYEISFKLEIFCLAQFYFLSLVIKYLVSSKAQISM